MSTTAQRAMGLLFSLIDAKLFEIEKHISLTRIKVHNNQFPKWLSSKPSQGMRIALVRDILLWQW